MATGRSRQQGEGWGRGRGEGEGRTDQLDMCWATGESGGKITCKQIQ